MDYRSYLSGISFCLVREDDPPRADGRYALARETGAVAELLELPDAPLDVANTRLPGEQRSMKRRLREVCSIPRMSTLAIGSIINYGVSRMEQDQVFLNIGLWNGFTFLSGIVDNQDRTCIGVDNFSQFGGPKDDFDARFRKFRSARHRYYDMDYVEYFEKIHTEPIGFYIYDGEHSYDNQLRGLRAAEPFFADGCIVLVDDTNWPEPRQATMDFIGQSGHDYDVLLDRVTCCNEHPTWWNGVMVLRRGEKRNASTSRSDGPGGTTHFSIEHPRDANAEVLAVREAFRVRPGNADSAEAPLVSIVIDGCGGGRSLEAAMVGASGQTYPNTEVILMSDSPVEDVQAIIADHRVKVVVVPNAEPREACAAVAGFRASQGRNVLFVDGDTTLSPAAVELSLLVGSEVRLKGTPYVEWIERLCRTRDEMMSVIPSAKAFIVVDEGTFGIDTAADPDRQVIPFLERDGQYWGPPPDDETAIRELERLRGAGATHIVFAWPAFWWLDHYEGFRRYLEGTFPRVLANDRLVAFDLRGATDPWAIPVEPAGLA